MDKLDQKIAALRRRVVGFCNAIATTPPTTTAAAEWSFFKDSALEELEVAQKLRQQMMNFV